MTEGRESVIVTGASGNLGRAVARRLAASYRLVLVDLDQARLETIELPGEHLRLALDLSASGAAEQLAETANGDGALRAVVATVGGFGGGKPVHEEDPALFARLFALNVEPTLRVTRAAAAAMLKRTVAVGRPRGSIVTIGSLGALSPSAGYVAYSLAKAAVVRLTEGLALELAPHGINANSILPGTMDTPANRAAMPAADPNGWVKLEAVADAIAFLISDAAAAVTGSSLRLPGLS